MPNSRTPHDAVCESRDGFVPGIVQPTAVHRRFVHRYHVNNAVPMIRLPLAMAIVHVCLYHAVSTSMASHPTGFPCLPLAMHDYLICPIYAWPVRQSMRDVAAAAPTSGMNVSPNAYSPFVRHSIDYSINPYYSLVTRTVCVNAPIAANKWRHGDHKYSSKPYVERVRERRREREKKEFYSFVYPLNEPFSCGTREGKRQKRFQATVNSLKFADDVLREAYPTHAHTYRQPFIIIWKKKLLRK